MDSSEVISIHPTSYFPPKLRLQFHTPKADSKIPPAMSTKTIKKTSLQKDHLPYVWVCCKVLLLPLLPIPLTNTLPLQNSATNSTPPPHTTAPTSPARRASILAVYSVSTQSLTITLTLGEIGYVVRYVEQVNVFVSGLSHLSSCLVLKRQGRLVKPKLRV